MRDRSLEYYLSILRTIEPINKDMWEVNKLWIGNNLNDESILSKYTQAAKKLNEYFPWEFLCLIHIMEASMDFSRQILNGDLWHKSTTNAGKKHIPYTSWENSTQSIVCDFFDGNRRPITCIDPTVSSILYWCEGWNGWGYAMRDIHSPYIVGGSNLGEGIGKFSSDGNYNPKLKTKQMGCALYLQIIMESGKSTIIQ